MLRHIRILALTGLLLLGPVLAAHAAAPDSPDSVDMAVSPATVLIGAQYDGTTLTVTGSAPADCEVVVRFQGPPEDLHMKEKGKALGLLWMNMGSVTFEGAPKAYLVSSSRPLDELVGPASADLPLSGLAGRIRIEAKDDDHATLIQNLLLLKADEGLYRELPDTVTYGPAEGGMRPFTATLALPAKLPVETYSVDAVALRDGAEVARATQEVAVKLTGVPSMMARLAFDHGALYGVLATLIALFAGLGVGLVFKSKGGAH